MIERERNLTQSSRRAEHGSHLEDGQRLGRQGGVGATLERKVEKLGDFEATLNPAQEEVGDDSQEGGRNRAGKDYCITDHGDATENESAQSAGADGGGDGGHANGDDRRSANTGKDHGARERKTNAP